MRLGTLVASLAAILSLAAPVPADVPTAPKVVSVVIDAPEEEASRLKRYVSLQPGTTLQAEAVRRLVELVFATGQYEDVVVDAEAEAGGVRLVVRPRPAPLLRDVRIEGKSVLDADEVRRISGLREREALFPSVLERAASRVEAALAQRGYPGARASAVTRRVTGGADAVFAVAAGKRLALRGVEVEGAGSLESVVRPRLEPKVGEWFDAEKARRSAERCREYLSDIGHWRATVAVKSNVQEVAEDGILVFRVDPGPRMALAFEGNVPGGGTRKAVERIIREGKAREDALDQAGERIEAEQRRKGARGGVVSRRTEDRRGVTTVIFAVARSPLSRVAAVSIEGWPRPPALATRIDGPLDQALLEQDVAAIRLSVLEAGHPRPEVSVEVPPGGGNVPVVFRVVAGPKTILSAYRIEAPAEITPLLEEHATHLRTGEPYRVEDVAAERDEVVTALRNAGFSHAEAVPAIGFSDDAQRAEVTLRVDAGRRDVVGRIVIAGLEHTREEVVRREIVLQEGEPLGLGALLDSQRRLSALGLFRAIEIDVTEADAEGRRHVVVRLQEASPTSVTYGAGYGERDNLRLSIEVTRRNLSGMNRTLSTFARWSFTTNRFLATYREPRLGGRQQDLYLSGFREEEERDSFSFRRFGGSGQTVFGLGQRWSAIVRYSFQETETFRVLVPIDEVDRRFQSSTFSGPSVSFVNDSRDDALDPSSGHFLGIDSQLSLGVLGGDSFVKTFVQAGAYRRAGARTVLAVAARAGLGRAFGESGLRLPLPDRFFAGGDYSLRGYALDTAGPLVTSTSGDRRLPTGGNALLLGSLELRFNVARRFSFALFTDAGNVYPFVREIDLSDVLYAAGAGIRYRSPVGPLRLDWGYKLNRRPQEKPYAFHVTIGHAF